MLIEKRLHAGIRDGSVTVLLRRWRTRQARPGGIYRTAAGRIAVDEIEVVEVGALTLDDARRSGHATLAETIADLRGDPAIPLYRLRIRYLDEPDPRAELAAHDDLDEADLAALDARLARLDLAGPWTARTLELIAEHPARRAGDLAAMVGREILPFKVDVRKLKNLGLTLSLEVGYRLSPRGLAYVRARSNPPRTERR